METLKLLKIEIKADFRDTQHDYYSSRYAAYILVAALIAVFVVILVCLGAACFTAIFR